LDLIPCRFEGEKKPRAGILEEILQLIRRICQIQWQGDRSNPYRRQMQKDELDGFGELQRNTVARLQAEM
jgi:hypothetical protein